MLLRLGFQPMKRTVAIAMVPLLIWLLGLTAGFSSSDVDPHTHVTQSQAFGAIERQAFTVLRGPTRPVPAALRHHLRQARNPEIRSLRLAAARYISTDTGFWVVNGLDRTCIVQAHGGAVGCESRTTLLREGIALGVVMLGPPPRHVAREFLVAGIVPDQIDAVELRVGHRTRTVAVHDNAYSLRAPVPIMVKHLYR